MSRSTKQQNTPLLHSKKLKNMAEKMAVQAGLFSNPVVTPGPAASSIPNFSRWVCIYPLFINSEKTVSEGRKISKEQAVPNPTLKQMYEAAKLLNLPTFPEVNKTHPADFFNRGRLRVQLKQDGKLIGMISSRKELMIEIARLVVEVQQKEVAALAAKASSSASSSASGKSSAVVSAAAVTGSPTKKKNKK